MPNKKATHMRITPVSSFKPADLLTDMTFETNGDRCGATFLVNMRDIEPRKEDDGFDGAFLSP